MKILLLINWKIEFCDDIPLNKQPSDYCSPKEKFWMFKYFQDDAKIDVVDIGAPKWIEKIENKIRFHFYQTFKILNRLSSYDLILIHGSDSAMFLGALKRFLPLKTPPIIVVDISSFHQADEQGIIHKLCQISSKSFDHLIYHTSTQVNYFQKHFPWLVEKSTFIRVGVDHDYWTEKKYKKTDQNNSYIVCVGYRKRDWDTLIEAYRKSEIKEKLYLIGNPELICNDSNIEIIPFIPIEKLMEYIYNARFSIIPLDDFNYSFGQITLLQQMALGTPIIAADVPALRDYSECSKGVVTYEPYNVEDLCNKIQEITSKSEHEMTLMKSHNINATISILNEQRMAENFEDVCLKVMREGNI